MTIEEAAQKVVEAGQRCEGERLQRKAFSAISTSLFGISDEVPRARYDELVLAIMVLKTALEAQKESDSEAALKPKPSEQKEVRA